MSTYHSPTVEYTCTNDCRQSGCPGHKLRLAYHATSDTVTVEIDGEGRYDFDDDQLAAIVKAYEMPTC